MINDQGKSVAGGSRAATSATGSMTKSKLELLICYMAPFKATTSAITLSSFPFLSSFASFAITLMSSIIRIHEPDY